MKLISLLTGCLLLAACNNDTTTGTSSSASSDTGIAQQTPLRQESQSTPPAGRAVSDAMMGDMRKMMADMKAMQMSGDPDHDFAMMMKIHHEAAVAMANRELQAGADAELKDMAEKMKADQQKEAGELQSFLDNHKPNSKSDFGMNAMKMMQASPLMNLPMKSDPDQDFAALMAQHHKEAIDMSEEYLKSGNEAKLKGMARTMISKQKQEIGRLGNWTERHASKGS